MRMSAALQSPCAVSLPYPYHAGHIFPQFRMLRLLGRGWLLFLLLFAAIVAPWPVLQPSSFAASQSNPNPHLSPPSWLTAHAHAQPPDLGHYVKQAPKANIYLVPHQWPVSMTPATLDLTAQAQHFLSNDGRLEVRIPAGAVSNAQLQAAGGKISLTVTQILPGSGGLRNEHVLFGTYELQLHDAFGAIISNLVLAHPLVLSYHLFANQQGFLVRGQTVYALWRSGDLAAALAGKALIPPKTSTLHLTPTPTSSSTASRHPPLATTHTSTPTVGASSTVTSTPVTSSFPTPFHTILFATGDRTGLVWSISTTLSSTATHSGVVQTPSTITFGTQAPQAT